MQLITPSLDMLLTVFICCVLSTFLKGESIDPCDAEGHSPLYRSGDRGCNCSLSYFNQVCDHAITEKWYRIQSHDDISPRTMLTKPPQLGQCGTSSPIWLNGLHPSLGEGIVNRTACGLGIAENETCFSQYNIMVKNCSTFYVYFLPNTHRCNEGYCFGESECSKPDPCHPKNYRVLEDDGSRSISCINSSKNLCDSQLSTDWYRVVKDASDILMPTKCVNMLSCGTTYPIWLNGTYPEIDDKTVERIACVSSSPHRSCCEKSYDIKLRNCSSFFVYQLQHTLQLNCPERYCFGKTSVCIEETTAPVSHKIGKASTTCSGDCVRDVIIGVLAGVCVCIITFAAVKYFLSKNSRVGSPAENKMDEKVIKI